MRGPVALVVVVLGPLLSAGRLGAEMPATPPGRSFGIGPVDLAALAAALPTPGPADSAASFPAPPTSLRSLRESVDRFLENDVKAAASGARLRESGARWNAATGGAAGPRSADLVQRTVQDAVSPPASWGGDGWAGLLTALLPASIAALSFNPALGEARACLSFLDGYERRVRAFRDGLPATEDPAEPELLLQWRRLEAELSANATCRGRGSR
jgi:hypothetical protein